MEEARLDHELERIYKNLTFLWKDYHFHIAYLTRSFGSYALILGLENEVCKLLFTWTEDSILKWAGKKSALFRPTDNSYSDVEGWYPLTELFYGLSGVEYEPVRDTDQDLANLGPYLRLSIDKVLGLFQHPDELDRWLEYYRDLYKDQHITMEQIRAERARLKALGQDASVEAAIASLRGGIK